MRSDIVLDRGTSWEDALWLLRREAPEGLGGKAVGASPDTTTPSSKHPLTLLDDSDDEGTEDPLAQTVTDLSSPFRVGFWESCRVTFGRNLIVLALRRPDLAATRAGSETSPSSLVRLSKRTRLDKTGKEEEGEEEEEKKKREDATSGAVFRIFRPGTGQSKDRITYAELMQKYRPVQDLTKAKKQWEDEYQRFATTCVHGAGCPARCTQGVRQLGYTLLHGSILRIWDVLANTLTANKDRLTNQCDRNLKVTAVHLSVETDGSLLGVLYPSFLVQSVANQLLDQQKQQEAEEKGEGKYKNSILREEASPVLPKFRKQATEGPMSILNYYGHRDAVQDAPVNSIIKRVKVPRASSGGGEGSLGGIDESVVMVETVEDFDWWDDDDK